MFESNTFTAGIFNFPIRRTWRMKTVEERNRIKSITLMMCIRNAREWYWSKFFSFRVDVLILWAQLDWRWLLSFHVHQFIQWNSYTVLLNCATISRWGRNLIWIWPITDKTHFILFIGAISFFILIPVLEMFVRFALLLWNEKKT